MWTSALAKIARSRNAPCSFSVAVLLFLGALALRLALARWLDPIKFLTFYPAVAAAALFGWPCGMLVVALSAASAWYLFFEPYNSFALKDYNAIAALVGFALVGSFIVLLVAMLRDLVKKLDDGKALQEQLFRELQHRVANNLQVVVTLLANSKRQLRHGPEAAGEAITEAEDRIHAMAQLHRRLYQSIGHEQNLSAILKELLDEAFHGLDIEVETTLEEAPLSFDQRMMMLLLCNEAATNAAKHVFRKGLGRRFAIDFTTRGGACHLTIRDDGPGFRQIMDAGRDRLGVGIMESFARQLGGSLDVAGPPGTVLSVEFAPS